MTQITRTLFDHEIRLTSEPEGGYTVTVPELPGCITYGDLVDHAMIMAREAIELYSYHYLIF